MNRARLSLLQENMEVSKNSGATQRSEHANEACPDKAMEVSSAHAAGMTQPTFNCHQRLQSAFMIGLFITSAQ